MSYVAPVKDMLFCMKELDAKDAAGIAGGLELLTDPIAPDPDPAGDPRRWDYPGDPTPPT